MPVFNGERYIHETLDSILGQTFTDFDFVISDNASTDSTEEICRDYARRDERISFTRHAENRGASWNYGWVLANSSGPYYKWAAHDDLIATTWLERCVQALDDHPDAVLAFTGVAAIDADGVVTRLKHRQVTAESDVLHHRFREVISVRNNDPEAGFGLIRRDALRLTRGLGAYGGPIGCC